MRNKTDYCVTIMLQQLFASECDENRENVTRELSLNVKIERYYSFLAFASFFVLLPLHDVSKNTWSKIEMGVASSR